MTSSLRSDTKLIFLVGAPRSGTTWLQLLLSASPRIASSVETHLFSVYARSLFTGWKGNAGGSDPVGLHLFMTEQEYFKLIRQFTSCVLAKILTDKPGADIVLEKTPDHARCWEDILAIYPDAYFIHLIRDPRAVTASLLAGNKSWAPWEPSGVSKNCMHWITNVSSARLIGDATDKYIEVFYEDLTKDGPRTLKLLFDWCGIAVCDDEVQDILRQHSIERLRVGKGSELAVKYRARGAAFFRKGESEGWRAELTRRQVALIEDLAGAVMDDLGYTRETASHRRRSFAGRSASVSAWIAASLSWRFEKYANALSRWT